MLYENVFYRYSGKISTKFNKYEVEAMLKKMLEKKKPLPGVLSAISARRDHRLDAVAMSAASSLPNQSLNVSGLRAPHSVDIWRLDDSLPHVFEKKYVLKNNKQFVAISFDPTPFFSQKKVCNCTEKF